MKIDRLDVVAVLLTLALLLVGCGKEQGKDKEAAKDAMRWQYLRSPLSGRCYEVAQGDTGGNYNVRIFAMNEVPCTELERYYKQKKG